MRGRRLVYPLVVGYLLVVGLSIGVLVQRRPPAQDARHYELDPGPAVPALAPLGERAGPLTSTRIAAVTEAEVPEVRGPLWAELFRPSLATARLLLQRAIPLFGTTGRTLVLYETTRKPHSILEALFPFAQSAEAEIAPPVAPPATPGDPEPRTGPGSSPVLQTTPPGFAVPQAAGVPVAPQADVAHRLAAPPVQPVKPVPAENDPAPEPATSGAASPCGPGGRAPAVAAVNGGRALVGIYHTHEYESYVSEFPDQKPPQGKWDLVATLDPERNVIRVGARLAEALCERGVTVVHSPSRNAYTYLGAYSKSLETAELILEQYPSVGVLLDLHRDDAPRSMSTAEIGGLPVARIAIVVGRGSDDLPQPNWRRNAVLAQTLHETMEQRFPGLSRGIILKDYRYNQHLLPGAVLLEVGSAQNTMAEALRAADLLAGILADVLREGRYPR